MKKAYHKPVLYAEAFRLSEHVAGSCGEESLSQANYADLVSCGLKINGQDAVAFQTRANCHDWYNEDLEEWVDIYCYNSFTDISAMFVS